MSEVVEFSLADSPGITSVRLQTGFGPGRGQEFVRADDRWTTTWSRPQIDRLEYQFTVQRDGAADWILDPANPRVVANPFGAKSELLFPQYRPPAWLGTPLDGWLSDPLDQGASGPLGEPIPVRLWSPSGLSPDEPAPLVLAHDGSDLADRGALLRWASAVSVTCPLRVALLDPAPGRRDDWYSANPSYTAEIAEIVLPALKALVAMSAVIGLGASLGGVAVLELARAGLLAGAVLQSGSFFTATLDGQEHGFPFFDRVRTAAAAPPSGPLVPVVITCGTVEENRANNERMAALLADRGHPVDLRLVRDAHTMISWRDGWSPAVDQLVGRIDGGTVSPGRSSVISRLLRGPLASLADLPSGQAFLL